MKYFLQLVVYALCLTAYGQNEKLEVKGNMALSGSFNYSLQASNTNNDYSIELPDLILLMAMYPKD